MGHSMRITRGDQPYQPAILQDVQRSTSRGPEMQVHEKACRQNSDPGPTPKAERVPGGEAGRPLQSSRFLRHGWTVKFLREDARDDRYVKNCFYSLLNKLYLYDVNLGKPENSLNTPKKHTNVFRKMLLLIKC